MDVASRLSQIHRGPRAVPQKLFTACRNTGNALYYQIVMHNMFHLSRIIYECGLLNQKTPIYIHREPRTRQINRVMIQVKNMRIERSKSDRPCPNIIALISSLCFSIRQYLLYNTHKLTLHA